MKTYNKIPAAWLVALLLMCGSITAAQAQRGHFGGGMRVGFGGGMRTGVGFHSTAVHVGASAGFRGFYHPVYYNHIGLWLDVLPYGYYPFAWGADQYYYYDGTFYEPYNDGYQVAAPPVGATVPKLPKKAQQITINGTVYYEFNGVYYLPVTGTDGKIVYQIAGKDGVLNTGADAKTYNQNPQVGDMTDALPDGSRKVKLDGKKYWLTPDGVYLEEVQNGDQTSYRVASVPDENDQQ